MKIANQLRATNIAEYLLYMWQMEDLLRANDCDMDLVRSNIINRLPEEDRAAEKVWLSDLCNMMYAEGVTQRGHLQINKNVLGSLAELHNTLLASNKFPYYNAAYYNALPFIVELRAKAGGAVQPEIETCLNALYGELMLKLQKKPISEGTQTALKAIKRFVAMLAAYEADERDGKLKLDED